MVSYGIEIEIPSPYRSGRLTWVMTSRGCTRYMDEVHVPKSDYNNPSKELITEKAVEIKEPCSTDWRLSRIKETHATSNKSPETVCYTQSARPI